MTISISTDRALRRPGELQQLINAVLHANAEDESTWIEWKSEVDITSPDGACKVARAIIGFANRLPESSRRICDGLAYLIIGAAPGNLAGTTRIDGAILEPKILRYLGDEHPVWSYHYIEVEDKNILVILVESPQTGDPIYSLATEFSNYRSGTVYVRNKADTTQATYSQLRQLQRRLVSGRRDGATTDLRVSCRASPEDGLLVIDPTPETVDDWIAARRHRLIELHQQSSALVETGPIDQYLEQCRKHLNEATKFHLSQNGLGFISVCLTNEGDLPVDDIELTLRFDEELCDVLSSSEVKTLKSFPPAPRPRRVSFDGNRRPWGGVDLTSQIRQQVSIGPAFDPSDLYPSDVAMEQNVVDINYRTVRQGKTVESDKFFVFLNQAPPSGFLTVPWTMTAPKVPGQLEGELQIPVGERRGVLVPATITLRAPKSAPGS